MIEECAALSARAKMAKLHNFMKGADVRIMDHVPVLIPSRTGTLCDVSGRVFFTPSHPDPAYATVQTSAQARYKSRSQTHRASYQWRYQFTPH
jgi:hypothetical protein